MKKTLGACKLSTKGQVTVPSEARKKFNLNIGDVLLFIDKDGVLLLEKG
ncbi:MAG: AbrB/MazE/SpoVT family DNA-binding domain-containing protein [Candidatus Bathyarchaeota archaeon]|nr:AbrB/MazE/SpoVT family DNA-binding domain-containing protein [Thermoproteota archaeon]MDT8781675.1 AbrB/MazE/SpoVT family DNA-binding domain-containing protein [Candidatus Bathyarchaeota archaeon]